ncbi:MAG: carbon-nitrogen hydrolase family protein [Alteromonadaceae bacterium]|nr:carbon-nitrogen hydrolase family protein [Alteromonadaceae bacterium]
MIKLSAIQLCSGPDVTENLEAISRQLTILEQKSVGEDKHLVVLPECCLFFGGKDVEQLTLAKKTQDSQELLNGLLALAKQFKMTLVAGTIPLLDKDENKFTNTCCVFSPEGNVLEQYDKIHLFDVDVKDNEKEYRESLYTKPGEQVVVLPTEAGNVGLSVCYDLRFPELYRQLRNQGADIITVPSAFTRVTGKAHWQTLLQARAIENQVYIIAAGQEGVHANGRETWGHSMIISPWGEILSCLENGEGVISAQYSNEELSRIRNSMPINKHNKFTTDFLK